MDYNQNDIVIRLKIEGDKVGVDARKLLQAFDTLEISLYESDRRDIQDLLSQGYISKVAADASLERLRRFRHHRLILRNAERGSIVLEGVVAAVSLYILEGTLGELAKDAIKESKPYSSIKEWFRNKIDEKASFIVNSIQKELYQKKRRFEIKQTEEGRKIEITFKDSRESKENVEVPSLGDELKKP